MRKVKRIVKALALTTAVLASSSSLTFGATAAKCNHPKSYVITKVLTQKTCTRDGKAQQYCKKCGKYIGSAKIDKAAGHNYQWKKTGKTSNPCQIRICSKCGNKNDAKNHNYKWIVVQTRNNVKEGGKIYRKIETWDHVCSNCGRSDGNKKKVKYEGNIKKR